MITHNLTVFFKPDLCPKCIDKITLFFAMYAHDIPFHLLSDFLRAVTHITFMQHIVFGIKNACQCLSLYCEHCAILQSMQRTEKR